MKPTQHLAVRTIFNGIFCLLLCASGALALPVARIKNMHPTVQVRAAKGRTFRTARERQALNLGDYVRTNSRGKALLVFSNGTRITMKPNTTIQIVPPSPQRKSLSVRLFGALAQLFVAPKSGTQIITAAGTAAARGTSFLVSLPDENTTVVTVIEDTVDFYNPQGRVLVNAGQQSTARVGEAPTPPVAVDVTGLTQWTLDMAGMPVEFELPLNALGPQAQQNAALATAQGLYEEGQFAAAADSFQQALNATPNDAQASFGLGQALRQNGDAAGAIAAYQQAQKLAPDSSIPRIGLALAHLSGDDAAAAKAVLQEKSSDAAALRLAVLGLIELRSGHNDAAITQLVAANEQDPALYQSRALLALAHLAQNNPEAARTAANSAVDLQPESAMSQSALALTLFFSGQSKASEKVAARAVEINPFSSLALLTYGRALLAQNKTDEAKQALGQAAALSPDLPMVLEDLGVAFLRLDEPHQAEKVLRRALELNPNSQTAKTRLAVALQQQGQAEEAEALQREVLSVDPQNPAARASLASLLIEEGRFDEAEKALGTLAEEEDRPEYAAVYIRLSELMLYRGKLLDAQDYARRAVRILPSSAPAHYQLGRVYLEQGRSTQAQSQFREAATLDNNFPAARYALGFAQQQAESGLLATPSLSGGAINLGSPAAGLELQTKLQSPGAADRVQAALLDPAVARVASRSLGDTQVDAMAGGDSTYNLKLSHLQERGDRRGVLGLVGSYSTTDGPVGNADRTLQNYSFLYGQKGANTPHSVLLLAEYQVNEQGLGAFPHVYAPYDTTARRTQRTPQVLLGFHLAHNANSDTRMLLQYGESNLDGSLYSGQSVLDDARSYNVELRHDHLLNDRHFLSIGGNFGQRHVDDDTFFPGPPFSSLLTTRIKSQSMQFYVRDEFRATDRLKLTGEIKVERLQYQQGLNVQVGPFPPSSFFTKDQTTQVLPAIIAQYRANNRTGLQVRARRLMGGINDFKLLTPRDLFLFSFDDLPRPRLYSMANNRFGTGESFEFEITRNLHNGTLLRLGLFHQNLNEAYSSSLSAGSEMASEARIRGIRLGAEGAINREMTYFINLGWNDARGQFGAGTERKFSNVPDVVASAGLQYLSEQGYFVQPTYFYLDKRLRVDDTVANSAHIFNIRLGKRFGLRSELYVELANILNEQYDVFEEIQPGRQLRIGGQLRF